MKYYQCTLRRGDEKTIGWIEERGAKQGAMVELKEHPGGRWLVETVWGFGLDDKALREKQARDRHALSSIEGK
jgi:hypothetical protein